MASSEASFRSTVLLHIKGISAMAPNLDNFNHDLPSSPDSSIALTPIVDTPTSSEATSSDSDSGVQTNNRLTYGRIRIPVEQNLREMIIKLSGTADLDTVTQVKLRVISRDVSLQHLSMHTPNLKELTLDGSYVSSLRDLGCRLVNLTILRVNRCSLTSLDGLMGLEHLEELYAANNMIDNVMPCTCLEKVKTIDVRRNRLSCIRAMDVLQLCPQLENLHLEGNEEIEEFPKYRQTIKNLLPNLKTLDGTPFNESECREEFSDVDEDELERYLQVSVDKKLQVATHAEWERQITLIQAEIERDTPIIRPTTTYSVEFPPKVLKNRPKTADPTCGTRQEGPSLLTSGAPVCGNLALALKNRTRVVTAWEEGEEK